MLRKCLIFAVAVAGLALAAACGGGPSGPNMPDDTMMQVTKADSLAR